MDCGKKTEKHGKYDTHIVQEWEYGENSEKKRKMINSHGRT